MNCIYLSILIGCIITALQNGKLTAYRDSLLGSVIAENPDLDERWASRMVDIIVGLSICLFIVMWPALLVHTLYKLIKR